jgi:hypothetical protein
VNPDLSEELASFMEDYFVPHLTKQVAELLKMNRSVQRGFINFMNAVEGVGLLWALASDEQKAMVRSALLIPAKLDVPDCTDFDDSQIKDVFG